MCIPHTIYSIKIYIVKKTIYCFIFPNWHQKFYHNFKWFWRIIYEDFNGGPVVKTEFPLQGAQVRFLVRELRSLMLCSQRIISVILYTCFSCTIDSWTTLVWTSRVYLCTDFFQNIYHQLFLYSGTSSLDYTNNGSQT